MVIDPQRDDSPVPAVRHPVDQLRDEHRAVLELLDAMERESTRLHDSGRVDAQFWPHAMRSYRDLHDGRHHFKEEQLLFPALEALGLDPQSGPTAVLRGEHTRGRFWVSRVELAFDTRDLSRLHGAATGFVEFQRQHIHKEDQILFPLAIRLLPQDVVAVLAAAFARCDLEAGPATPPGTI